MNLQGSEKKGCVAVAIAEDDAWSKFPLSSGQHLPACNAPAQGLTEPDGRFSVSFMHPGPEAFPLVIEARRTGVSGALSSKDERLTERAHQDREIVYFLQPPETGGSLSQCRAPGEQGVLALGSQPRHREMLRVETIRGDALPNKEEEIPADAEVVVAHFDPVSETSDGRIRLDFINPRPDEIAVLIHARRRP